MSAAIDFLKELADLLVNQDNHFTASPNYCIQEHRIISGIDEDYGGEIGWFDDDNGILAEGEEADELEAAYQETGEASDGWIRCGYKREWAYTGISFLTDAEALAYVAKRGHRHNGEIRVYTDSHCYNAEMKEVRRLLAGPVVECINALAMFNKAITKAHIDKAADAARIALAALDAAKEPHQ